MDSSTTSGLRMPTFDDMRRLLAGVNALHGAAEPQRADVLARQVVAVLGADAAAVDYVSPDGLRARLATVGEPDLDPGGPIAVPPTGATPDVTFYPPSPDRAAGIRSVYRHDGTASALVACRDRPFDERDAGLLRLFHPAVAWAIEPAPVVPPGVTGKVLNLMLTGLPEKEIARRLDRSTHTIHGHVKRVYKHYGVRSRSELIITLTAAGRNKPVLRHLNGTS